jgi:hypothetical protein
MPIEGPIVGWLLTKLGPVREWFAQRFSADHAPIAGRQIHQCVAGVLSSPS